MMLVGEPFVVETHQMKDGSVQIIDVHFAVHRMVAKIVGDAMGDTASHAAAGHPHGEAVRIVLPAGRLPLSVVLLGVRSAAELAAPQDQGVMEQASHFQIG